MNSSKKRRLILICALALPVRAQTSASPATNPPSPKPAILDHPPSPGDAPLPKLDGVPAPVDGTKSKVRRALDRLTPNCADVVYHSCWSSPAQDPSAQSPEAEREAQRNREAGELYYSDKNYKGSEARFREALRYEPVDPVATFDLAESLEKLGKKVETREAYQTYLTILPNGPSAARARKAIKRLPGPSGPQAK